jgi:hypothetical protein
VEAPSVLKGVIVSGSRSEVLLASVGETPSLCV